MTGNFLSVRERRVLLLGASVLGAIAWVRWITPLQSGWELDARARILESELALTRARRLQALVVSVQSDSLLATRLRLLRGAGFRAATADECVAQLTQYVAALGQYAGVVLESSSQRSDRASAAASLVGARFVLRGPMQSVVEFLRELEVGPRFVVVRWIKVDGGPARLSADGEGAIRVELEVLTVMSMAAIRSGS